MTIRVKFEKTGRMVYIGHLDLLRFFQKAIRRCGIAASFTNGYSPHIKITFAAPLPVGMESYGEYFDLELARCEEDAIASAGLDGFAGTDQSNSSDYYFELLSGQSADGIRVSAVNVLDKQSVNCAAALSAAKYQVRLRDAAAGFDLVDTVDRFMAQDKITVTLERKTTRYSVDLLSCSRIENLCYDSFSLTLPAGNALTIKPEAFTKSLKDFCPETPLDFSVKRVEMYFRS